MNSSEARRVLNRHARHYEQWTCGRATIHLTGKDENPRFDRRIEVFLRLLPHEADPRKIGSLLSLIDTLA